MKMKVLRAFLMVLLLAGLLTGSLECQETEGVNPGDTEDRQIVGQENSTKGEHWRWDVVRW